MAGDILEKVSQDEKARAIYQQREKWRLDKISSKKYLLKKGKAEGVKGVAIRLLQMGMDITQIVEATGLSRDEIECIRKGIK